MSKPPASASKKSLKTSLPSLQQQLVDAAITASQTISENDIENEAALLRHLIVTILQTGKDSQLFGALDALWETNQTAYEVLADHIEMSIESAASDDGKLQLFLAIPILVWSRNTLPAGKMDAASITALKQAMKTHWLADAAELYVGDTLYTPDTLPDGFCSTYKLANKHFVQAEKGLALLAKKDGASTGRGDLFLADSRFLLAVVRGDSPDDFFKVLLNAEGNTDLATQETQWREKAHDTVAPYFVGCAYDVMPPKTYYEANRSAELAIRGFSLHAAILMVMTDMEVTADELRAVIAPCHSNQFEEYRISILLKDDPTVLQGVSWPLLGREETQVDLLDEIMAHLKVLGLSRIRLLEDEMPMEFCDDCEAPLFPDPDAEMVHVGQPDDGSDGNSTRHTVH